MKEKIYDKDLGKYIITSKVEKENKEKIKSIAYKDIDLPVAENLKDYITELNKKILELDNSISYLTEERRNKIIEYQNLKKQWEILTSSFDIEYEKRVVEYTSYEDLVHKKALIQ